MQRALFVIGVSVLLSVAGLPVSAAPTQVTVDAAAQGKPISPDLFGIFFEDLNYAADGGIYPELIENRSFEYRSTEQPGWNPLSFWELVQRGGGKGRITVGEAGPVHPNNPHYLVLSVANAGEGVGLMNAGFGGIAVQEGETYEFSVFARSQEGPAVPMVARLESKTGELLAEAPIEIAGKDWKRVTADLRPDRTDANARFVLLAKGGGDVGIDVVSLFPRKTFKNRPNGLRPDLAQTIADLHPKFVRFPGGCLAHGDGIGNIYRWKDTIGPIEQRKEQANIWRYHQSVGLGYHEYFQFCEDIGAKPLPVLAAGVSCQNSDRKRGTGQQAIPMKDMPAYVQDVLDLIEYANGPATSTWGAKRAAAGHPEPFHLEYLGIGNEDKITPEFKERFRMIYQAVKKSHPEITIIGTVGPADKGADFDAGWRIADELKVPMVDEHYYMPPQWFLENQHRYDRYDRNRSKVYLGEYASRGNTLFNALAEGAYMTGLERNADVVRLASYAPLLARLGNTQWNPDLIYFNNEGVFPTVNYYVQQMFARNSGDRLLPMEIGPGANDLAASAVRDSKSGDVMLKLVNPGPTAQALQINFRGLNGLGSPQATVLSGDPKSENRPGAASVTPKAVQLSAGSPLKYEAPAYSLTVIRIPGTAKR